MISLYVFSKVVCLLQHVFQQTAAPIEMGADGRFVLFQDLGDLCGGISLVVKEMDGLPVLDGKSLHRVPDKGKVLPLLRSQGVAEFICRSYFVVCQAVFAQISRYTQEPGLLMFLAFQGRRLLKKLQQRLLQDLLASAMLWRYA